MATSDTTMKLSVPRRRRIRYTNDQLKRLESVFSQNQYPDSIMQEQIANEFGVSVERVHVWFQNRRSKFKRESRTNHMMWMRKQIFDTEDGKGLSFPFGTPRLPALTSSCHVLSPPDTAQYARQDAAWEKPSANVDHQHSPPFDFNPVLDLRISPESKSTSTPKTRIISTPSNSDSHCPNSTFSNVSFTPCRYSSPSPVSTLSMTPKNYFSPSPAYPLPRNVLSPIGLPINSFNFYRDINSASSSGFQDETCSFPYSPYPINWFPSPAYVPPQIRVLEDLPVTKECGPDSGVGNKRKCTIEHSEDSTDQGIKRLKSNTRPEPETFHDTCVQSLGDGAKSEMSNLEPEILCDSLMKETGNAAVEKEQDYNSDSSTHVDLEQWC